MTRRLYPVLAPALTALAVLACALPGAGGVATPAGLGPVQTQVAQTLTAQAPAANPAITLVAAATQPASTTAPATAVPPTAAPATAAPATAAPTPAVQCYVAIGDASTVLCVDGPNQAQVADARSIGTIASVAMSSDGGSVAYLVATIDGSQELWLVNADGSHARKLADKTNLPSVQPNSLSYPKRMQWQAGSHTLYFDTGYVITSGDGGPGEYANFDLWKLDTDSGALTQVLTAGSGGYFSLSPDGKWLAITRPQDVSLVSTDGAMVKPDLVTFTPIITYSEYAFKPEVVWSTDSAFFSVSIPSKDPQAADASATLYKVAVTGDVKTLTTIQGKFLMNPTVKISPDGQWVAYLTTDSAMKSSLHVSSTAGGAGGSEVYDQAVNLFGWAPDSQHFAFAVADDGLYAGTLNVNPQPLATGVPTVKNVIWSDPQNVVFSGTINGHWGLYTAALKGVGAQDFAGPFSDAMVFGVR